MALCGLFWTIHVFFHCYWPKVWQRIQARAWPKPSVFTAMTPSMALLNLNHFIFPIWV
jgi:hypothetical protein